MVKFQIKCIGKYGRLTESILFRIFVCIFGFLTDINIRQVKAVLGLDLICVFDSEDQVREMNPDQDALMRIEGRIQNATARGNTIDCVSRSFCPKLSIAEDPVCGSAHVQIADYWLGELGKDVIDAYQASKRGGYLQCERRTDGRMSLRGEAVLVAISELAVSL